jgi:hypothetical protein
VLPPMVLLDVSVTVVLVYTVDVLFCLVSIGLYHEGRVSLTMLVG